LLASTTTRVYQSAFFALRDTVTPARVALVRVVVALVAGAVLMLQFESVSVLGVTIPAGAFASLDAAGAPLGPLGLAVGASLGAWVEWLLLRRALGARLGRAGAGAGPLARMFVAAALAAAVAYALGRWLSNTQPLLEAAIVAAAFGSVYVAAATVLGQPEARELVRALLRRSRR
jgi:putative peptidoglycan lipid II flippase